MAITRISFLFLVLLFSLSGCGSRSCINTVNSWDYQPYRSISSGRVESKVFCHEKETDTNIVSIDYMYYPVSDSLFKDTVNYVISEFVQALSVSEPDSLITDLSTAFFQNYLDSFSALYRSNCEDEFGLWEADMIIEIDDSFTEFVQLSISQWVYEGGAHGNSYNATIPIDRKTGVVLQLTDYFSDINSINKVVEPYFRKVAEIGEKESLKDAGFWFHHEEFEVNNNFTFSDDSVTFFYNHYEIAPYAAGVFEVTVPLDRLEVFMKRPIK
ncbi:MAG: RsiV family protein [Crocinitomicaceae bacterium]|nr:RsiV family protein [Crocinitomicaceae bacterium]